MTDPSRPWLRLYGDGVPADLPGPTTTVLERFAATAQRMGDSPFLHYFDRSITFAEADEMSDALAVWFTRSGVRHGDRVAIYVQNDPDFAIAQLGAWKAGAACVSVNPMLREQELEHVLCDSGAVALVVLDELWHAVARGVVPRTNVRAVLVSRVQDWEAGAPPTAGGSAVSPTARAQSSPLTVREVISELSGIAIVPSVVGLDEIACIGYTSGTSGRPKGVVACHANLAYSADVYRSWMSIDERDVFLCGAPLFHVTGLVAGLALSYTTGMALVLFHRFVPRECLRMAQRWRATCTVMAITAFRSLMSDPDLDTTDLRALVKVYSGGAPVASAIEAEWRSITGHSIHNVYGLTETTGPTHAVPLGRIAPIDPQSAAMSVGVPVPGAHVRIVDPASGVDVAVGEPGEIWIAGPMVMKEYWGLPDATRDALVEGYFRTGDVGIRDADGWFYVVDRLKDMINASGFKVWPREVEDFLLQHPAVSEAAVVGVPDEYRGESVKAFVVLREGATATPEQIVEHCKQTMAAYKYPRAVEIVDALPKTATGKVLRRALRTAPSRHDVPQSRR